MAFDASFWTTITLPLMVTTDIRVDESSLIHSNFYFTLKEEKLRLDFAWIKIQANFDRPMYL